jgi:mutual gliding-motility protein MglA
MLRNLRIKGEPYFEAVALRGIGVFDTLKACAKQVLIELSKK